MSAKCTFVKAWIGACNAPTTEGSQCEHHSSLVCVSCGADATHECPETLGLVCGAPLCPNCKHVPDGYKSSHAKVK